MFLKCHLFKEPITERLGKLAVLHQQKVAQRLEVSLRSQLHKEVVHHCLVHQGNTGDGRWRTIIRREKSRHKNND